MKRTVKYIIAVPANRWHPVCWQIVRQVPRTVTSDLRRGKRGTTLDEMSSYTLEPIGFIRSTVKGREDVGDKFFDGNTAQLAFVGESAASGAALKSGISQGDVVGIVAVKCRCLRRGAIALERSFARM
jgi:hypothetical protein